MKVWGSLWVSGREQDRGYSSYAEECRRKRDCGEYLVLWQSVLVEGKFHPGDYLAVVWRS